MKKYCFITFYLILLGVGFFDHVKASDQPLHAEAALEKKSLFVGESVTFQIQVAGSDNPKRPNISDIDGMDIVYQGGQQNSSSSITIVNGRVTKDIKRGYTFSYQLTPKRAGRIVIPEIAVHADGKTVFTKPVFITAQTPLETDDYKLRLRLSKTDCYVGEPIMLTAVWYMGKDVRSFHFNLPFLEDTRFYFEDKKVDTGDGKKYYRIPIGGGEVIGVMGRGRIGGRDYSTLRFQKILIPKESGDLVIEPATVAAEALAGYRRRKNPFGKDFFSDFFADDFFGKTRSGIYRKVVVPSNSLTLKIYDLPHKGKPDNFSGHVGEYKIQTEASPTEVSVGDPVTLKIALSGPEYLENIELPPLDNQKVLTKSFKIPKERAVGEIVDNSKIFTQTIRALRPGINEIPPIMLSYFDTKTKRYMVANSKPIPISVKTAHIVTAQDAEGAAGPIAVSGSRVETWSAGIDYNYDDISVLENKRLGLVQWLKSPLWIGIIGISPVLYLILLIGVTYKRRLDSDPLAQRVRRAYTRFQKTMKSIRKDDSENQHSQIILESFRRYLGDKLRMPGGVITFNDVKDRLDENGVDQQTRKRLKDLFEKCEAGSYAGNLNILGSISLVNLAIDLARRLEKQL